MRIEDDPKERTMPHRAASRLCVWVLILILLPPSLFPEDRRSQVDELFSRWDGAETPGCALAVIQDGRIIYTKGYGTANLELGVPITPGSVFYTGSVSKQFVAMSIALLIQRGELSLEDDVRLYIPELPEYDRPITTRHLVYHTSGIRDYLTLEGIAGIPLGQYHEADVLELICRQKELNFSPGEEHLYSNSGYFLLAVLVERVSGKSLREFAEESIFQPLGMRHTLFHDDYTRLIPNRASGYFRRTGNTFSHFLSTFDNVGSGGLFSSVEDLFLWDQNFYHQEVGGREVFELMHTTGELNSGEKLAYAFAINVTEYRGLKTVYHGGALGGYRAGYVRFPEQKFSVIILANLDAVNPTSLCFRVAEIYLGRLMQDPPTPDTPPRPERPKGAAEAPAPEVLKQYVGEYVNEAQWQRAVVTYENDGLRIKLRGARYLLLALGDAGFMLENARRPTLVKFRSRAGDPHKFRMEVRQDGRSAVPFVPAEPYSPSEADLAEYQGDYTCPELPATYSLRLRGSRVVFVHRAAPRTFLVPFMQDLFSYGTNRIRFIRDEKGTVRGFGLDAGRVRNLRFIRSPD
jgi:CubicO group peptidase (beta-lactamase class C family)